MGSISTGVMLHFVAGLTVLSFVFIDLSSAKTIFTSSIRGYVDPNNRTLCPETPQNRPPNRVYTTERLSKLRAAMTTEALDAYLVFMTDEHGSEGTGYDARVHYISGFSGSNGWAVITHDKAALWTDGRYFAQADNEMDCNWMLMKIGQPGYLTSEEWIKEELPSYSKVGAYPKYVGTSTWQSYLAELSTDNITMVSVTTDLVDQIWNDSQRPPKPNPSIIVHTLNLTGRTWEDKLADVRGTMAPVNADILVVTVLEQVAWLFNLRGGDISNSLFYAYALIAKNVSSLYLRNFLVHTADSSLRAHLNIRANGSCLAPNSINCINVYDYDNVTDDLQRLSSTNRLWIDPASNYAIYNTAGDKRIVSNSPIEMMKSIKNSVEIQRFTECIVRDSAAVAEFAAILEKEIEANRPWTEMDVMANLSKIRRGYEHNRGDSFETIAAYGSNAAIIHYTAKPETDRRIDTSSVFLLDSGGQYLDGTTDITRTFHYGTPTDKIKEAYTRILIGQIDLATTVWPEGLYGSDIDIRARSSLWTRGWNYNHGTGHGIGYFLSVHEGPGRIGTGYSSSYSPLYEGMFFSDEPGYYEDGDFGIRLEILVLIVKANITDSFEGRKYLAFKPLTLVPYETKLINYDMLSPSHKIWLNEYNQRCRDEVGKYLTARNKQQAYEWILARTELLPLTAPNDATRAGSAADRIIVLIGGGLAAAYVAIHVR